MSETKERRKFWISPLSDGSYGKYTFAWFAPNGSDHQPVIELHDGDVVLSKEEVEKVREALEIGGGLYGSTSVFGQALTLLDRNATEEKT